LGTASDVTTKNFNDFFEKGQVSSSQVANLFAILHLMVQFMISIAQRITNINAYQALIIYFIQDG
jgi:hypothetical protein